MSTDILLFLGFILYVLLMEFTGWLMGKFPQYRAWVYSLFNLYTFPDKLSWQFLGKFVLILLTAWFLPLVYPFSKLKALLRDT